MAEVVSFEAFADHDYLQSLPTYLLVEVCLEKQDHQLGFRHDWNYQHPCVKKDWFTCKILVLRLVTTIDERGDARMTLALIQLPTLLPHLILLLSTW